VHCLEAALDRTCPQHRESTHRPDDPLEVLGPKVLQLEEIAEEPARGLGNDNRVRLGDALKACREVRRVSPTISCSCASPDPTRSPTTTIPVAAPIRTCRGSGAGSVATASIRARPARAARSASSSGCSTQSQHPANVDDPPGISGEGCRQSRLGP
jgi:hypothetical protein